MSKIKFFYISFFLLTISVYFQACQKAAHEFEAIASTEIQASANFWTYDIDLDGSKEIILLGDKREITNNSYIYIYHIIEKSKNYRKDSIIVNDAMVNQLCFNDFNNDGLIDFIANKIFLIGDKENIKERVSKLHCETTLFINHGDNGFKQLWSYRHEDAFQVTTMASEDFDGDGNVDIVIGGIKFDIANQEIIGKIQMFNIDNAYKMQKKWEYKTGKGENYLLQVSSVDINNDEQKDIIALVNSGERKRGELLAFLNNGGVKFEKVWQNKKSDITNYFYKFKIADLNMDGYDDIVAILNNEDKKQVTFFINSKNKTFNKTPFQTDKEIENKIYDYDIGDFDGNGDTDIILATEDSTNSWLCIYSNNNMQFKKTWENHLLKEEQKPDHVVGYDEIYSIFAFDFDNDGKSDFGVVTEHLRYNHLTKEENERIEMQIFKNNSIK